MCDVLSPARSATCPIVSSGSLIVEAITCVLDLKSCSRCTVEGRPLRLQGLPMPDLPIARTLSPEGMTARLALFDALAADGLIDRTPTDAGLRVRLRDTPEIEQRARE